MDESEFIERLIAAIQISADPAAAVTWDEKIGGRQFDVVVRFNSGLSRFLVAIECKHEKRPIDVSELDAFVTKGRDAKADKLQFFSTSGFQIGAITVATRHGVDIFRVTFPASVPEFIKLLDPAAEVMGTSEYVSIPNVCLHYSDGKKIALKYSAAEMTYYEQYCRIEMLGNEKTLKIFLDELIEPKGFLSGKFEFSFRFDTPVRIIPPDNFRIKIGELSEITLAGSVEQGFTIKSKVVVDPYSVPRDVEVENVLTGEIKKFSETDLPFGLNNKFESGRFYFCPASQFYYYCDSILGDTANLILVESFQHGELVRAAFSCSRDEEAHQIEVIDKEIIERLRYRLEGFREPSQKPTPAEAEKLKRFKILGWPPHETSSPKTD